MNVFAGATKVLLLIGILWLAGWGVKRAANSLFINNEEYKLQDINLVTNGTFSKQRIVEVTRIKQDATLFSIDPEFMEGELESLPEVVNATVKRSMPNHLNVTIKERVPVAYLHAPYADCYADQEKKRYLIGQDGFLFPCEGILKKVAIGCPTVIVEKGPEFAFKSGEKMLHEEALRAQSLISDHNKLVEDQEWKLISVTVVDFYTLVAEYDDGLLVTYGMYDHERQVQDLLDLRKHATLSNRELQWIDLRPKRNIPGQYKITQR